jgi:hypothetical protein
MFQNPVVWTESGIVITLASELFEGVERPLVSRPVSCILKSEVKLLQLVIKCMIKVMRKRKGKEKKCAGILG